MGQVTKCDEGHFYDESLNKNCPHCGLGEIDKTVMAKRSTGGDEVDERTIQAGIGKTPARRERSQSRKSDEDVTVAVWRQKSGIDPVVGWLVCHEGPNQGRDYRIQSGRNVIGRDTSSQICISGDDTISRENHAKIFFDTRNATFHVTEGEGRSGVYVNGSVVLQPTLLSAYDILEVGATKLVFVPLCGEKFRWDNKKSGAPDTVPVTEPKRRDRDLDETIAD